MSLSEATLKKLSKDEVINLLLDYQNKFETTLTRMNTDLSGLRQDLSDLKENYIKLESELSVARQVNNKLKEHIVSLERQCWSNSQYSRRECLDITGILDKTDQKDLVNWMLKKENWMLKLTPQILRTVTGYRARSPNVQLLNPQNEKMQTEFVKGTDLTLFGVSSPVFINISLCQYYKMLWHELLTNKFIDSFWVSN